MEMLREILHPDFLLRNSVLVSVMIGALAPLFGVFLVMRRMVFLGVALPHISATGIALALSLHVWLGYYDGAHGSNERILAIIGSIVFAGGALLVLALLERRGSAAAEGRIGAAYVIATATSILLLAKCPQAERGWLSLFKGEIIAVSDQDLILGAVSFALLTTVLLVFRKELLLVSYDRALATVLRKNVVLWDVVLYALIGLSISISVFIAGPLITFGFMLIPPLIAQVFARSMRQLGIIASIVGGAGAFAGFCAAYHWDLPIGPSNVAVLGAAYVLSLAGSAIVRFVATRTRRTRAKATERIDSPSSKAP
ncbi:MAG: ABC-type Mn2+/Zn2+ transport system permease subunit [Limisphaerales bacterium]|jgi:ABC-type Mn2+/Zn2+ transport system permease subunit